MISNRNVDSGKEYVVLQRNGQGVAKMKKDDALGFEIGNRIKGYLGSGYFGGYANPSGIPENNIMEGTVNRAVYIEKY
jgi:hypothetical protein